MVEISVAVSGPTGAFGHNLPKQSDKVPLDDLNCCGDLRCGFKADFLRNVHQRNGHRSHQTRMKHPFFEGIPVSDTIRPTKHLLAASNGLP